MVVKLYKRGAEPLDITQYVENLDARHIFSTIHAYATEFNAEACLIDFNCDAEWLNVDIVFNEPHGVEDNK